MAKSGKRRTVTNWSPFRRMKPSKYPAGTRALPRARLKARNRSQIAWVSTFQQGSRRFRALISSAQGVLVNVGSLASIFDPAQQR